MNILSVYIRRFGLLISMLLGATLYLAFANMDLSDNVRCFIKGLVDVMQPTLLFLMLLITFLKIKPADLSFRKWQLMGLLFQGCFWIFGCLLISFCEIPMCYKLGLEGFLLCMICPTATAAAVITGKLSGNQGSLVLYIIMANLLASLLIPLMLPLVSPQSDVSLFTIFLKIVLKIFPLLFSPLLCAMVMRKTMPYISSLLIKIPNLAFYLWLLALSVAIAVSVKIMHKSILSGVGYYPLVMIVVGSIIACVIQFSFGRWYTVKHHYPENEIISSSQALGQKNTIFAIWCGYTFMDPLCSIAGGFYSIWHNIYNSYQLNKKENSKIKEEN